jgi:RNA polymerase-interacting CarD/CdnL/TRCF family regulator
MSKVIINNITEMVEELFHQLQNKDANLDNYRLLNNLEVYLQNCVDIDLNIEENKKWEIQNFCDNLNLEFPVEL